MNEASRSANLLSPDMAIFFIWFYIVAGYSLNVLLEPLLIFKLKMGIKGAAIAHVISQ